MSEYMDNNGVMPENDIMPTDWIPENSIIKVIGVGGGGCNAVNYMYNQRIEGCTFIVCNTDAQALNSCDVPIKIQLATVIIAVEEMTTIVIMLIIMIMLWKKRNTKKNYTNGLTN